METFTPKLTYGCAVEFQEAIKAAQFGDGYAQRAPDGINSKRLRAKLSFQSIRSRKAAEIIAFLTARGATDPFLFTPPSPWDEQRAVVVQTPWEHTVEAFDAETIDVTFVEDFSGPSRVKTPTLAASAKTSSTFTLTLACATSGASIYWTYDPDQWPARPTSADTLYTAPLTSRPYGFYRARAIKTAMLNSLTGESEVRE